MIRFACPNCDAVYSVAEEKAGKTGQCPKCLSQFLIPVPDPTSVPSPNPAPDKPVAESIEITPCPGCQARIAVHEPDLKSNVECPYCATVFVAERVQHKPESKPDSPRDRDWGDEDRPTKRRSRRDEVDDDDVDEDRPRRRRSNYRSTDRKPGNVGAIGGILLGGAIYGLIWALAVAGMSCCLRPGVYFTLVWSILAIVRASAMLGQHDRQPAPRTLLILQILCILNLDIVNLILGIVGLNLLNDPDTQDYFDRHRHHE